MANDFSTGKSIFVLAIVAGCFAVLWPNVFYPMIQGSYSQKDLLSSAQEHLKQERPPHLRPEFLHPALREKGRAIPHTHVVPKVSIQEGRTTPIPGIRPPMGGPGQVVPPPKTTSGTMGVVMPMYTIGIIVFFLYTMMKLLFKKSDASESLECFVADPDFHKTVFKENNHSCIQDISSIQEDGTKIGWRERDTIVTAISGLVEEVNRQIRSDQVLHSSIDKESETLVQGSTNSIPPDSLTSEDEIKEAEKGDDEKSVVKVLGMEMTESCEHGGKWSRPPTPLSRPSTPQNIFISGSLPSKSQLLVSDSLIETIPAQDDAVVLTGKVTLSLIGYSENNNGDGENTKCESNHNSESKEIGPKESILDYQTQELGDTIETRLIESNGHCCKTGDSKDFPEKKDQNDMTLQEKLNIKCYNTHENSKKD
ncbi:unnamed protein product [Nezara viridula]|uniref:Resistance to inhibitors of cholinesterase protein 3 N-terminal domain-containing protein n=1 Tax=Nezara viridula TaxID=85310 RepID=A0A9P0E2W9_NEZVI|nr:unnamed protein product [Nezara viridula]